MAALRAQAEVIGDLSVTFTTATEAGVSSTSPTLNGGAVTISLGHVPETGTNLTVVNNTGLAFISGSFANLAHGQAVTLSYGGVNYDFVANYYGGTGNDLVLQWARVRVMAWGKNDSGH